MIQCNGTVLCVEFIVVTATVDIVQWYSVVFGDYCGYSNSRYSAILLCFVWSLLWLQKQQIQCNDTVQFVEVIVVTATVCIYCNVTVFFLQIILVTASVEIVQFFCALYGVYCGYSNKRYSAMLLCCVGVYCGYSNSRCSAMFLCWVWNLLWLEQQQIQCNDTVFCVAIIVVKSTVGIVLCYWVVCGVYYGYNKIRYSAMVLCCVCGVYCD